MNHFLAVVLLTSCSVYASAANDSTKNTVSDCNSVCSVHAPENKLDTILENIANVSSTLKTLEADLAYLTIQDPDIVESKTLQTGRLHYLKEADRSFLRIRFDRLKQDEFPAEESVEDYYFDGVWLTKVDYKLEQINLYQQAPEDKPVDVFELINDRFPLIGFSGSETLKKDFDVSIIDTSKDDPNEPIQLLLQVKKDSRYQEDYKKIDFWLEKCSYLPVRVKAYSTQGDIYDVRFSNMNINKKLKNAVFKIETPTGFRQNIQALETVK
ncbi:MAG: hypothetical protein JW795_04635 [Chitinivibrionales bacterium]|nr:hypothetical protein [Chitinivibrionales bacterium]